MNQPDYLPLSYLNHLEYCERRFWLIYVQGEMEINAAVLEGSQQHERVHTAGTDQEGEVIQHRRLYLWSDRLQIVGVDFHYLDQQQAASLLAALDEILRIIASILKTSKANEKSKMKN